MNSVQKQFSKAREAFKAVLARLQIFRVFLGLGVLGFLPTIAHGQGHDFVWVRQAGSVETGVKSDGVGEDNFLNSFALDPGGNAVLVGRFDNLLPGFIEPKFTNLISRGAFCAKYDPAGTLHWVI